MSLRRYLPSTAFIVMVGALALSGGLVAIAQLITRPAPRAAELDPDTEALQAQQGAGWQKVLQDIEAESGVKLPEPQNPEVVHNLLTAAQSSNLTTEIGRTIFVNLSSANSQGLGQDIPTQDQLIAEAAAKLKTQEGEPAYTKADLVLVAQTQASLRAYGNGLITALLAHPDASPDKTYETMGYATDYQDASRLTAFPRLAAEHRALAAELAKLPTPATLGPLHLQLVNDISAMAGTYGDMAQVIADPLRGLAGLKEYQSLADEAARVFTNIGQTINKDGILFSKDEPGAAWDVLLGT